MDLSYLKKFNELPKNIKDAASAPEAVARVNALGEEYKVDLAATVMRVMVRDVKLENLGAYLINELGLPAESARVLEQKLRRSVFAPVIDYLLGADKGPKLVFHEADEKQVRASAVPAVTADFDKQVDDSVEKIVAQSRINFSDPLASGKFRQVLKTYLRGSRDKLAVNEVLTKAAELGGLALSRDTAERVLIIAGNFVKAQPAPAAPVKIRLPEDVRPVASNPAAGTTSPRVAEYDLEASLREQGKLAEASAPSVAKTSRPTVASKRAPISRSTAVKTATHHSEASVIMDHDALGRYTQKPDIFKPKGLDVAHELMPPAPAVIPAAPVPSRPVSAPAKAKPRPEPSAQPATNEADSASAAIATTPATATPAPSPRRQIFKQILNGKPLDKSGLRQLAEPVDNTVKSATGKVRMDDIRYAPQTQSPIDELRNFNLVSFRRLDPDPAKAIAKIRENMETLGREDYGQKIEAIVAWQQSPLNRLYLSVCRRSLDEGLALGAILERELKKEPAFLRQDELAAIIELNRSLKF